MSETAEVMLKRVNAVLERLETEILECKRLLRGEKT